MTTLADAPHPPRQNWLAKSEAWLDDKGKGAWIALMILGFVVFWPLGLAVLAYMIWSKRMFNGSCGMARKRNYGPAYRSTGNAAFDAYRSETLRRLEEEQEAFQSFLERLRAAKDKVEFDQFMEERARRTGSDDAERPAEA